MDTSSNPDAKLPNTMEALAKRRKVRKGTFSCWECKRLKMKCVFDPDDAVTCNRCRRKGCPCIGQEYSEVPTAGSTTRKAVVARSKHGEQMYRHVAPEVQQDLAPRDLSTSHGVKRKSGIDAQPCPRDYSSLSQSLFESLPLREDLEKICEASKGSCVLTHELLSSPYTELQPNGFKTADTLLEMPHRDTHPVLIARYILQLVLFLQRQFPDLHKRIPELSESPRAIMLRIADLAIRLVTTNDEFLGSIESLECVMMESVYKSGGGNLRQGWLVNRRAMNMAQLMGLHQSHSAPHCTVIDPKTSNNPQFLWYRIVDIDRYLCLMLGLPQGSNDRSMGADKALANDTAMGCLERIQCVIASRILERNERKPGIDTLHLTRTLDMELQKAARKVPGRWWLVPDFSRTSTNSQDLFWDIRKLYGQVAHYYLLNQLHLPFMLRPAAEERNHEYSRITCVNASRELLTRFTFLRKFDHVADSCRLLDFLAIIAAMTLLLAHLDSHQSGSDNLLAHQYLSDRAMIESVQENMEALNRFNSDTLSAQSADLLRRLLALETDIEDSVTGTGSNISVQVLRTEIPLPDCEVEANIVTMQIPYFGTIKITRNGVGKEPFRERNNTPKTTQTVEAQLSDRARASGTNWHRLDPQTLPSAYQNAMGTSSAPRTAQERANDHYTALITTLGIDQGTTYDYNELEMQNQCHLLHSSQSGSSRAQYDLQSSYNIPYNAMQAGGHPGLIAGADEWAFQGVDMAFFESLMSSGGSDNAGPTSDQNISASMNM